MKTKNFLIFFSLIFFSMFAMHLAHAQTHDDFTIETRDPTDTVFVTDFYDPLDTGGHLNIEFYKNGNGSNGYFRLYYAIDVSVWPGDSLAAIKDSITSPYDLITNDKTNYMIRIYWLDEFGNHSPHFGQAGPLQSIDNNNVYVGILNTYEFGTMTYPYTTIQKGIDNVLVGGTVNVDTTTYSDPVQINKAISIKGTSSNIFNIDADVTLDAKPITITDAKLIPPHSWFITNNALIQDGIDASSHRDSIIVFDGTYLENIVINKKLYLSSICGNDSTFIQAANSNDHVVKIIADSVIFKEFSVYGAEMPSNYKASVYLNAVSNCQIVNNNLGYSFNQRSDYGLLIQNSNYNRIEHNNCSYNFYTGIFVEYTNNNNFEFNQCYKNLSNGIFISNSFFNVIKNNSISENNVFGLNLYASSNNIVFNNVSNSNDMFGISLVNCSDNHISNNVFENNSSVGLRLVNNCTNNVLVNNLSASNEIGLHLAVSCSKNTIVDNVFSNNTDDGIVIDNSSENILIRNTTKDNTTFGINIISSNNNEFYLNTLRNNSFPVNSSSSINSWNSPTPISYNYTWYSNHKSFLGNNYDDYYGYDSNNDGIGDIPFNLPGNEPDDDYPLMLEADNYSLQAWWLHSDSSMYKDFIGNPMGEVTIPSGNSNVWISNHIIDNNVNFSTSDTWTGQIQFSAPPESGSIFSIELGYSTIGTDFIYCGPDASVTGDGSSTVFTYITDGESYSMPAGTYYAIRISNNSSNNYNIRTGGGVSYISAPVFNPELFLNPSDSLNFGKIDTTNVSDSTLVIKAKNIGKAPIIIDSLSVLEQPFSMNFTVPDTIQPGDSVFIPITLELEFTVGYYSDLLEFFGNFDYTAIAVTAELTEPIITVQPGIIDFGTQPLSVEEDSLSFVIKNTGSSKLIVNAFSGLSFPFSIHHETPDTVYPDTNDSSEVFIVLDRTTPGFYSDTLWIYNNDVDTSVVLFAQLEKPIISVTPDTIDFGTMSATNQSDSLSFVVKNSGSGDLIITGLDGLSSPFSTNCPLPKTIVPADSSEIFIVLDMSVPGLHCDTLLIENNDQDTSLVVTAEINAPIIALDPDSLDFGSMSHAFEYDSLLFIIKNVGTEDLIIDYFHGLTSPYSINYQLPDTISPQDSSIAFILLDKSIIGTFKDTLLIDSNSENESLIITADITAPMISIIPEFLDFGEQGISDDLDSLACVIKNIGTEDLIIHTISGLSSPFEINYDMPDTISVQDSSIVFIKLDKSIAGYFCDTLLIYNNAYDTSLVVTANIVAPIISLIPPDILDFGAMDTTSFIDSTKMVLIKNIGTSDLIIHNLWGISSPFNFDYMYPDTISPGDSTEIPITIDRGFSPGVYCDTLMIDNNDNDTTLIVTVELTESIIYITPENIDFGIVSATEQFDSLSCIVKNNGTGNLIIDGLDGLSSPFSINHQIPDIIMPGDSTELFILLDMSIPGLHCDTLLIANNDQHTSLVVTAEIIAPIITLDPDFLDFGSIPQADEFDSLSFVIKNIGTEDLIIDGLDGLSSPFSINHTIPATIIPGDSTELFILLDKSVPGFHSDTLLIANNDQDTSLVVTTEIIAPIITLDPDFLDFGSISQADETDSLSFIIKNIGTEDLIIDSMDGLSAPFSTNFQIPDTIAYQDSSIAFIKLDKSIAGSFSDTLYIYNNDSDTFIIVTAEITEPIISLQPDILDFGEIITSDEFDSLSFVIKNIGTEDLIVASMDGLSAPFITNFQLPDIITPQDSSIVFIILDKSLVGSFCDTLLIYNNDSDTSIIVNAEITEPIISIFPDSLDFGEREKSIGYDSLSFVIKNLGDGQLIIDDLIGLTPPFSVNHILPDTVAPTNEDSTEIFVFVQKNISGYFCDTLHIINNNHDTSLVITAKITEPIISIIPSDTLNFGTIEMSSGSDSLPCTIKNYGNGDLIIYNVVGLLFPFSINYSTPDTIYPLIDSTIISISVAKSEAGLFCDTLHIYNNDHNISLVVIAHISEPPEPIISYITDVPYDQGRNVVINWLASPLDNPAYKVITGYSIWREQNWAKDPWEFIGYIPAHYWDEYAFIAPTVSDSTVDTIPWYTFLVSAETTDPFVFYNSEPDSGYSVDNIPPNSVEKINMSLNGGNNLNLQWTEVLYGTYNGTLFPEINEIWYKVYGSENYQFECTDSNLITITNDTTLLFDILNKEKMFFKIITSDQPPSQK